MVRSAVAQEPDNGAYVDSLGWAHYQLGDYGRALVLLERAARLVPDDAVISEHLGDVYVQLGDATRAMESYRRALQLDGENREAVQRKLESLGVAPLRPWPARHLPGPVDSRTAGSHPVCSQPSGSCSARAVPRGVRSRRRRAALSVPERCPDGLDAGRGGCAPGALPGAFSRGRRARPDPAHAALHIGRRLHDDRRRHLRAAVVELRVDRGGLAASRPSCGAVLPARGWTWWCAPWRCRSWPSTRSRVLLGSYRCLRLTRRHRPPMAELEFRSGDGRRWTARYESGVLATWILWREERPLVWWKQEADGGVLSHRDGAQALWKRVALERDVGPLGRLQIPTDYGQTRCDGDDVS